jgi:hypothetical protein
MSPAVAELPSGQPTGHGRGPQPYLMIVAPTYSGRPIDRGGNGVRMALQDEVGGCNAGWLAISTVFAIEANPAAAIVNGSVVPGVGAVMKSRIRTLTPLLAGCRA